MMGNTASTRTEQSGQGDRWVDDPIHQEDGSSDSDDEKGLPSVHELPMSSAVAEQANNKKRRLFMTSDDADADDDVDLPVKSRMRLMTTEEDETELQSVFSKNPLTFKEECLSPQKEKRPVAVTPMKKKRATAKKVAFTLVKMERQEEIDPVVMNKDLTLNNKHAADVKNEGLPLKNNAGKVPSSSTSMKEDCAGGIAVAPLEDTVRYVNQAPITLQSDRVVPLPGLEEHQPTSKRDATADAMSETDASSKQLLSTSLGDTERDNVGFQRATAVAQKAVYILDGASATPTPTLKNKINILPPIPVSKKKAHGVSIGGRARNSMNWSDRETTFLLDVIDAVIESPALRRAPLEWERIAATCIANDPTWNRTASSCKARFYNLRSRIGSSPSLASLVERTQRTNEALKLHHIAIPSVFNNAQSTVDSATSGLAWIPPSMPCHHTTILNRNSGSWSDKETMTLLHAMYAVFEATSGGEISTDAHWEAVAATCNRHHTTWNHNAPSCKQRFKTLIESTHKTIAPKQMRTVGELVTVCNMIRAYTKQATRASPRSTRKPPASSPSHSAGAFSRSLVSPTLHPKPTVIDLSTEDDIIGPSLRAFEQPGTATNGRFENTFAVMNAVRIAGMGSKVPNEQFMTKEKLPAQNDNRGLTNVSDPSHKPTRALDDEGNFIRTNFNTTRQTKVAHTTTTMDKTLKDGNAKSGAGSTASVSPMLAPTTEDKPNCQPSWNARLVAMESRMENMESRMDFVQSALGTIIRHLERSIENGCHCPGTKN